MLDIENCLKYVDQYQRWDMRYILWYTFIVKRIPL